MANEKVPEEELFSELSAGEQILAVDEDNDDGGWQKPAKAHEWFQMILWCMVNSNDELLKKDLYHDPFLTTEEEVKAKSVGVFTSKVKRGSVVLELDAGMAG